MTIGVRRALPLVPRRLHLVVAGRARAAAMTVYRPGKRVGTLALAAALALPWGRAHAESQDGPDLETLLTELHLTADGYAAVKSTGREQWVAAIQCDGGVTHVMKIARGGQIRTLRHETLASERAAAAAAGFAVPHVVDQTTAGEWYAVVMQPAPPGSTHFDLEQALQLSIALAIAPGGPLLHGDFAPWNVIDADVPWLIDWEMSGEFVPGVDFAHYVLASAHIGSLLSTERADAILDDSEGHLSRYSRATGLSEPEVAEAVNSYRARFCADGAAA